MRSTNSDDADILRDLLERFSPEARWLGFLGGGVNSGSCRLATDRPMVLGLLGARSGPAGARSRTPLHAERAGRAEVAFEVADEWQGRGIATVLLAHLAELPGARHGHLHRLVLPPNHRMLQVFRDSGFPSRCAPGRAS